MENLDFTDKKFTCADCEREFIFTAGEQKFFWSKKLSIPKRCKACRVLRKRSLISVEEDQGNRRGEE